MRFFLYCPRNNPALRNDLYRLVGFKKLDKTVQLNEEAKVSWIYPDGISYQYLIELEGLNVEGKLYH
ncbi:MAG: hypothetical protein IPL08_11315 [Saprospiraceae bacterium]|nr:hypothetical protein [Saprospiraceae bacterium]